MTQENKTSQFSSQEAFIQAMYAEKKGRDVHAANPFTCYINTPAPQPDLPLLTASFLEVLSSAGRDAYYWGLTWDKSIITVSPGFKSGCVFLPTGDQRGKAYAPVSTTKPIDTAAAVAAMPAGDLGTVCINQEAQTTDAFLIVYFHMASELIWDLGLKNSLDDKPTPPAYIAALDEVLARGFNLGLLTSAEIIQAKSQKPDTSVRVYGSRVNRFVPQIMGAILYS